MPLPLVIRSIAAPPDVKATWNVLAAALTTKYILLITIPVVVTIVANETSSVSDKPCAVRLTVSPASVIVTAMAVVEGVPVPVTSIPVVIPAVLAIVTVVLPAILPPLNPTGATAPQFPLTMKANPGVLDVPRLAMILSMAVCESLQA